MSCDLQFDDLPFYNLPLAIVVFPNNRMEIVKGKLSNCKCPYASIFA